MTGNPIFVRYGMAHLAQCEDWEWTCTRCKATPGTYGFEWTAGDAADAGREHMRRFHPLDDWAADHPELDDGGYSRGGYKE